MRLESVAAPFALKRPSYLHECDRFEAHFILDRCFVRDAWRHRHTLAHGCIGLRQALALSIAIQPVHRRARLDLDLQIGHVHGVAVLIARDHRQLRGPSEANRLLDHFQLTLVRVESRLWLQPRCQSCTRRARHRIDEVFQELALIRIGTENVSKKIGGC